MRSLETLVVAVVLVGFVQDSIEDRFLSVPLSVMDEDQTPDRTPRDKLAICKFLCRSKRDERFEMDTSPLCIKECSRRKRAGESFSSVDKQTELQSPMSRSRRNTGKQSKECLKHNIQYPPAVVVRKSEITVDFVKRKPNLTIEWKPLHTYDEYRDNWTSYNLHYQLAKSRSKINCVLIPKDRHEWVIRDGDFWTYPEAILLAIITYPGTRNGLEMTKYAPPPPKPPTMLPTEGSPSKKIIVAISGLAAGIALLLILLVIYRKRNNNCWFFSRDAFQGRRDLLENPRIHNSCCADEYEVNEVNENLYPTITNDLNLSDPEFFYACYYPENERFQLQVASVVNFFRENGYKVVMDVMSCNELVNLGPTRWAEQQIKKARKILVFLSPGLLRMCGTDDNDTQSYSQEHERLWYELSLLRTIYSQTHSAARMICIALPQRTVIDARDLPLWAELKYRWPEDKRRILNRLNDRPIIQPL